MRGASPQTPRTTETTKRLGLVLERLSGLRQGRVRTGFTIVELLVVVVVIAILAAITIVAYNGITASAKESALKSDLTTAAKKLNIEKVESGSFPGTYAATGLTYSGGGNTFCITGSANGKDFQITENGNVEAGNCPLPVATTMQTFTPAHCVALDIFTGSNNDAVVNLTDSRGGTTRTYEVAKLADGKCWMLTNLKLGSTSNSITLIPNDSNVASNFTLPQIATSGGYGEYDAPYAYGPVAGDTGTGSTNYGYLYNFSAATAGETRTSLATGNAQYSICPAGWRLPTATMNDEWTVGSGDYPDLDRAFGGSGTESWDGQSNIALWLREGPFRGVLSGYRSGGQGEDGYFWSGSVNQFNTDTTFYAYVGLGGVDPAAINHRHRAYSVRCLLN